MTLENINADIVPTLAEHEDFDWLEEENIDHNLEKLYNASMQTYNFKLEPGQIVDGTIYEITDEYISLDINYKQLAYIINKNEQKNHFEYLSSLEIGDSISVFITKIEMNSNSKSYGIIGSYSKFIEQQKFQEILDSIGDKKVAFNGYVEKLIDNAGYIVRIDEFETFMPGSHASMNKLADPTSILYSTIPVMVVNYMQNNNTLISSHKQYLNQLIPAQVSELTKEDTYTGNITGFSKFGIFVQFNECLTGLIYKTNIAEDILKKFNERTLQIGESIDFKILEIVNNKRIILTQNDYIDPWKKIKQYKINYTYQCKVTDKKDYGYFVELEPNLIGLYSCDTTKVDLSIGQKINLKLIQIDKNKHKLFLGK